MTRRGVLGLTLFAVGCLDTSEPSPPPAPSPDPGPAPLACDTMADDLDGCPPWVAEPLSSWLAERWDDGRTFRYHVDGEDMAGAVVTRR